LRTNSNETPKETVLMVDNDPEEIDTIGLDLSRTALTVVSATEGTRGITKACNLRPDIILLNAVLPDMNGLDVCRRLKANNDTKQIPVVLMYSQMEHGDIAKAIDAGADDYVTKPLDPSKVAAVLKANLGHVCLDAVKHPLINLPESTFIYDRIRASIAGGKYFAVMYLDIGYPRGFRTDRGAAHSKIAVRLLTEIVAEALQLLGNPEDLLGHLEEDSLVVITTPERTERLCRMITSQFDNRLVDLFGYTEANTDPGYVLSYSQPEHRDKMPLISVSVTVVANDMQEIRTPLEVEKLGAEFRGYTRCKRGSNYYFARRHDNRIVALDGKTARRSVESRRDTARLRETLSRIVFATQRLGDATTLMRSSIDSSRSKHVSTLNTRQQRDLGLIVKRSEQLLRLLNDLKRSADIWLASTEPLADGASSVDNLEKANDC
jgi:CheY-like chemotaxis protein